MNSITHQTNKKNISSKPVVISKKNNCQMQYKNDKKKLYSLTENVFDPSKFSPPNFFIANLKNRMNHYEKSHDTEFIFSLDNKWISLEIE